LSSIGDFIDLGGSEETNEEVKISLQTTGSPNPRSIMRIQIRISNKLFMALVDAGSTYNFMHLRVARRLGLDTEGCCLNL
jgi:predicted aspartyl protease